MNTFGCKSSGWLGLLMVVWVSFVEAAVVFAGFTP
jgi:hypothetical protein